MAHWSGGPSDAGGPAMWAPRRDRSRNGPPAVQGWPTPIQLNVGGGAMAARFAPVPTFAPPEDEQTDFERYYIESKPLERLSVPKA